MKIEDYDAEIIGLKKYQKFYSAKKLGVRGYTNFRSGDVSKFKLIHAKVKMIENKQTGTTTALLCGIQRLKSYQNDLCLLTSQEGIYFFHYPNKHIYGCEKYDLKTDLKFDSNGECLTIQVDRTNDLLSFVDDYNKRWSIKLSKVVGKDPFVFCFEMYEPDVEIQVQFFTSVPKGFPEAKELLLDSIPPPSTPTVSKNEEKCFLF